MRVAIIRLAPSDAYSTTRTIIKPIPAPNENPNTIPEHVLVSQTEID